VNAHLTHLIGLIQAGDTLLLDIGDTMTSAGKPEKLHDKQMQRWYAAHNQEIYVYIVAARNEEGLQMPIALHGIQQVQRAGVLLWDAERGMQHTQPIQLSLFEG
jgi:hypothetical protein